MRFAFLSTAYPTFRNSISLLSCSIMGDLQGTFPQTGYCFIDCGCLNSPLGGLTQVTIATLNSVVSVISLIGCCDAIALFTIRTQIFFLPHLRIYSHFISMFNSSQLIRTSFKPITSICSCSRIIRVTGTQTWLLDLHAESPLAWRALLRIF